jgi:hypothetical protein
MGARLSRSVYCLTTDLMNGILSLAEGKDFSSSLSIQTSSKTYPGSYAIGTVGPVSGGKVQPRRNADHSPSSTEVKNESSPTCRLCDGSKRALLYFLYA